MSTHSRVPTHTVTLGLTGRAAIDAVARDLAGDGVSLTLHKFSNTLGPAEHDIDLERAEEIMLIDPGLLRLDAEVAYYSSHDEICGFCGKLAVQLWTRYTGWVMRPVVVPNTTCSTVKPARTRAAARPPGCRIHMRSIGAQCVTKRPTCTQPAQTPPRVARHNCGLGRCKANNPRGAGPCCAHRGKPALGKGIDSGVNLWRGPAHERV